MVVIVCPPAPPKLNVGRGMWEKYWKPAKWRSEFLREQRNVAALTCFCANVLLLQFWPCPVTCKSIQHQHAQESGQERRTTRDQKDPSIRPHDLADSRRIMRRQRLALNQLVRQADPIKSSLVQHDVPRISLFPRALEDVSHFPLDARLAVFRCDRPRDLDRGFAVVDAGEVGVAGFGKEDEEVPVAASD